MANYDERHYNVNKLNIIFAIVSLGLLAAVGSLFLNDYDREWKDVQSEFHDLEIEKTRVKYHLEKEDLEANAEYLELTEKLNEVRAAFDEKCSNVVDETQAAEFRSERDVVEQKYRVTKAEFDAVKYEFEQTRNKDPENLKAIEKKYNDLKSKLAELKAKLDLATTGVNSFVKLEKDCAKELKALEKEEGRLASKLTLIERKMSKIDPERMSGANLIASYVRNAPILDLSNPSRRIEQIVLNDITEDVNFRQVPKVDRCITCHLGIANPEYEGAHQPFRTHPNLELYLANDSAHPMEEFGCTVCHGGRGRGTSFYKTAHTPSSEEQAHDWHEKYGWHEMHHWDDPMLPLPHVQASCFKCHADSNHVKGADKLNLGLKLIEKSGCYACHEIEKYKNWSEPGPTLRKLKTKISQAWAYRWIEDPKSFRHNAWMPSYYNLENNSSPELVKRGQQEMRAMVHYLFEISEEQELDKVPFKGDAKNGEELIASLGCYGCHKIQKDPLDELTTKASLRQEQGPNLIGLGTKTNSEWLYNWLKNPHAYNKDSRMPDMRLTDKEAADITSYLIKDKNTEFSQSKIALKDDSILTDIVQDFLTGTMTTQQVSDKISAMSEDDKLSFAGQKLIGHYGCYSCHDIQGYENYKPIGIGLNEQGNKNVHKLDFGFIDIPHTKQAWIKQKLLHPRSFDVGKDKSWSELSRMPNFGFSEQEADAITTAVLGFVKDDSVIHKKPQQTPGYKFISEGQELISQFNCQGCHIIEGNGGEIMNSVEQWLIDYKDEGATNAASIKSSFSPPNLHGVGAKLQSAWLNEFLHKPETVRPWLEVRMPTYNFSKSELNTLVKYFSYLDNADFPFADIYHHTMPSDEYNAAKKLFSDDYFNCTSCHVVGNKLPGGSKDSWAPNLALASERLRPDWLIEWIKNPPAIMPGTKMPIFYDPEFYSESGPEDIMDGDEDEQIRILRDYLMTLGSTPEPKPEQPKPAPAEKVTTPAPAPQASAETPEL